VVDVVSPDDPGRDWVTKRAEYAASGIAEYWIIDPAAGTLTILSLDPAAVEYELVCTCGRGDVAASPLLGGSEIPAEKVLGKIS